MRKKMRFAYTPGDGSAPEQMEQALRVLYSAAQKFDVAVEPVLAPMGWCVFEKAGDTLPAESFKIVMDIGIHFFGGVGEKSLDKTLGVKYPSMRPEGRIILPLRNSMGLLINERPAIYHPGLRGISRVAGIRSGDTPIPAAGIRQVFLRYLLEGEYFGNSFFKGKIGLGAERLMGLKLKSEVTGDEPIISNISYLTRENVLIFLRYAFNRARELRLPVICVAKANVQPEHLYFWINAQRMCLAEFPDVDLREVVYSDDAVRLLAHPELLNGVIMCTNKDGDMLSDGALEQVGSMGLMYSSAKNTTTGAAMFESGAGTFPEARGKDIANPTGRILTAALMAHHLDFSEVAGCMENAALQTLNDGFRTPDMFTSGIDDKAKLVGTVGMANAIISRL